MRPGLFIGVLKGRGALILRGDEFPRDGHQGEGRIVVGPRTALVSLAEAADGIFAVFVNPAVAVDSGLGRPDVHAPWQGDCRVGVAVAEFAFGVGALERIDVIDQPGGVGGGKC